MQNKLLNSSIFLLLIFFSSSLFAQKDEPRLSLKATANQTIGTDTEITIVYSRPGVKGRKIWGDLVPWGFATGKGGDKFPWRAGANENTTIEISSDVFIEGQKLAAGKYSIHMIPGEEEFVIMFNTKTDGWGSYKYDKEKDALRVTVKPVKAEHEEWLSFNFSDLKSTSAVAYLHWAELKIPFKISLEK